MREIKHLSVHQWLRSAIPDSQQPSSPIGFLFLKLPPPPCAVLLVWYYDSLLMYALQLLEVLPNAAFWSLKKQAPNAAAKLLKVRLCERQTPRPLMRPMLMVGVCRKGYLREGYAKEWVKVKVHFEGSGPVSLAKKLPNQQQPVLRRGFRDASCMFTRLWRSHSW